MELDLKPIAWEYVDLIHLTEDRDQWLANKLSGSIKFREFLDTSLINFSRWTLLSEVG